MFDPARVRLDPLGEAAWILRDLGVAKSWTLAKALSEAPGVREATSAYDTVGLYLQHPRSEAEVRRVLEGVSLAEAESHRSHLIPVCYAMSPDLDEAASRLHLNPEEVADLHSSTTYRCYAIGFCPGFPFLGYLPQLLQGLPRRPSPRPSVPPGSVGITGRQTGIYPTASPGGWTLIGRTPLCLVDVDDAYFPIQAGDEVRFIPIDEAEFDRLRGERL